MVFIRKILQFYEIKSPILRIFKVTASKDDNTNQTDYFYRFDQILATEIHEEKTVDEGGLSVEHHSADAAAVHHEAETLDLEEELAAAVHRLESFLAGKGHHHHQWEHWEENRHSAAAGFHHHYQGERREQDKHSTVEMERHQGAGDGNRKEGKQLEPKVQEQKHTELKME